MNSVKHVGLLRTYWRPPHNSHRCRHCKRQASSVAYTPRGHIQALPGAFSPCQQTMIPMKMSMCSMARLFAMRAMLRQLQALRGRVSILAQRGAAGAILSPSPRPGSGPSHRSILPCCEILLSHCSALCLLLLTLHLLLTSTCPCCCSAHAQRTTSAPAGAKGRPGPEAFPRRFHWWLLRRVLQHRRLKGACT